MGSCCNKESSSTGGDVSNAAASSTFTHYNGLKLRIPRDVEDSIRRGKQFVYLLPSTTVPQQVPAQASFAEPHQTPTAWVRQELQFGYVTPMAANSTSVRTIPDPQALQDPQAAPQESLRGPEVVSQNYCVVPRHIDRYIRHVSMRMTWLSQQEQNQIVTAVLSRSAKHNRMSDTDPRKLYVPRLSHKATSFKVYREMTFYLPEEEEYPTDQVATTHSGNSRHREESFRADSYGISQNAQDEDFPSSQEDESNDTPPLGFRFQGSQGLEVLESGRTNVGPVPSLPSLHNISGCGELLLPNAVASSTPHDDEDDDSKIATTETDDACFLLSPATLRMHNRPEQQQREGSAEHVSIVWAKPSDPCEGDTTQPLRVHTTNNRKLDNLSVFSCPPSCLRRPVRAHRRCRQVRFDASIEEIE